MHDASITILLAALVLAILPWTAPAQHVLPAWSEGQRASSASDDFGQREWLELSAVGLTGAGHLAFSALDQSRLFIPIATLGWGGYVAYRARTQSGYLGSIGLTTDHLAPAFRDATFVALGATALMTAVGWRQGTLRLVHDMVPLFLLYPIWGLVQQTLVQGMVSANLDEANGWPGSPYLVTPLSAALFGAVHVPNWRLTAATFAMGLAFTPLYLKHRSLWPLGLYHGGLGVLFYFWVLDENPWQDVVRKRRQQRVRTRISWSPEGRPMLHLRARW